MKVARTGLGVGALEGLLYAVGGRSNAGIRLNTTECYNAQARCMMCEQHVGACRFLSSLPQHLPAGASC